jgi:hypothetical protein
VALARVATKLSIGGSYMFALGGLPAVTSIPFTIGEALGRATGLRHDPAVAAFAVSD